MDLLNQLTEFLNQYDWVFTAKIVLGLIMLCMSAAGLHVFFNCNRWYQELEQAEIAATEQSAETMMQFTEARARLTVMKNRLFSRPEKEPNYELLQSASKIIMMAVSRERSFFQWGMLGVKVARSGLGLFQEQVRKLQNTQLLPKMVAGTTFDFKEYLTHRRGLVEDQLSSYLAHEDPPVLWESMRYSVLSGGKRLRSILCLAAAESVVGSMELAAQLALPCACAIELVHAMSLIHDDLPALDNDDLRRGRPTNHKVFGEAIALLAGDALLALSTQVLLENTDSAVSPQKALSVALELSKAVGSSGMVGGQVADMTLTGLLGTSEQKIDARALESMHKRKTGALIRFSAWSGACLAGASEAQLLSLGKFGEILGLAFQITDDLLDVTGDIKVLGKTPGKDEAYNKATWVTFFGLEESRNQLGGLKNEARETLQDSGLKDIQPLECLLDYAIERVS